MFRVALIGLLLVVGGSDPHAAEVTAPRVIDGPLLLHSSVSSQWGGHTFSYLVVGQRSVFWGASVYSTDKKSYGVLVGQYPRPGSNTTPAVTTIPIDGPLAYRNGPPLIARSPDGYLHVFFGFVPESSKPSYSPGTLRYFRSAHPEDITQLVDRTELIPREPYNAFHLRMNVGVSRDGNRLALVALAESQDGSVPFNTPVIFRAVKQGPDYVFEKPIRYAEPMALFYPLVAVVDSGVVVVGEVWDNKERQSPQPGATTRLLHIAWNGTMLHCEELPAEAEGNYFVFDLRPMDARWGKLVLYYNKSPKDQSHCKHEFWEYDVYSRRARKLRSIDTEAKDSNWGKWIPITKNHSVFLNIPMQWQMVAWEGDLTGGGPVKVVPLPRTNPNLYGFPTTNYLSVPSPLVGSLCNYRELYVACDSPHAGAGPEGSCSLLLYRIELDGEPARTR